MTSPRKRATGARVNRRVAASPARPVARWVTRDGRKLLVIENGLFSVAIWPEQGGAIAAYVHRPTNIDVIWRNPYGQPPRLHVLDQPMMRGSDIYDVMDGSWYVSLPNGFFAGDYFGAPLGTHGELRCVPWIVEEIRSTARELRVRLCGRSVRTPLVYRRELVVRAGSPLLRWRETLGNRLARPLPVAWLQHPTFGGPLLPGARLVTSARKVAVFKADDPAALQLKSGYTGQWPHVPERGTGCMRDCSEVPAAGSGLDHSVQLSGFKTGCGCIWNEKLGLGFGMEWDLKLFPYAWSWACSGGVREYPLWGEGHLITLQPSTSPVGRFPDLVRRRQVLMVPARGEISTELVTGFVSRPEGPWSDAREKP